MDNERGVPAPADLQAMADDLARAMSIRPIPIGVMADQPGVAALRGLSRRSRRIIIGEPELGLPTQRILAILAHEFAHAKAQHQQKALALSVVTWSLPQVIAGLVIALAGEHRWTVPLAGAVSGSLTGLCVLALFAILRAQEHSADARAGELAGNWVSAQLAHHFDEEGRCAMRESRLYATHPAPDERAARLLSDR